MIGKIKFDWQSDRVGPDCPFTHFFLYFKSTMRFLCSKKFSKIHNTAEFRPGAYAITCSKISLGKRVVIRPGTMLFADPRTSKDGQILISDDVMLGSGVHIYTANHSFQVHGQNIIDQGHMHAKTVILEEGCWVGANSIILPGVTIGKNAVVGAGSIVTKNVPGSSLVVGNPAVVIKEWASSGKD